jgi:hypothetical protein
MNSEIILNESLVFSEYVNHESKGKEFHNLSSIFSFFFSSFLKYCFFEKEKHSLDIKGDRDCLNAIIKWKEIQICKIKAFKV